MCKYVIQAILEMDTWNGNVALLLFKGIVNSVNSAEKLFHIALD